MGFSRQEYWSGFSFPSPEDLPDPGIKPGSPALQADALPSELPGKWLTSHYFIINNENNEDLSEYSLVSKCNFQKWIKGFEHL